MSGGISCCHSSGRGCHYRAQDNPSPQRLSWPWMAIVQSWETLAWIHLFTWVGTVLYSNSNVHFLFISLATCVQKSFLVKFLASLRLTHRVGISQCLILLVTGFQMRDSFLDSSKAGQVRFCFIRSICEFQCVKAWACSNHGCHYLYW